MKNYRVAFFIILIVGFNSCAQKSPESSSVDTTNNLESLDDQAKAQLAAAPKTDLYSDGKTKLIKTVNYRFEVDNIKKSTEAIELAVKKFPAYISASNLHLENPILENKITIRVQSEYFQELLKEIDQQARFINFRDVKTDDVSKEFVDLDSRLNTKREVEARYMEILRKKAGNIEDLFNAERQIGALHEEIEATISRINYLKDQVSYSTINLEFYQTIIQTIASDNKPSIVDQIGKGLLTGWTTLLAFVVGIAYIWPLVLGGIGVFIFFKFRKKKILITQQH